MNVVDMSKEANNGLVRTPEQMLEEALSVIRDPDDNSNFKNASKMLIISLDTENGASYNVNWMQAGMKMSECLALCDVAKSQFLGEMEYVVTFENIERAIEL